MRNRTDSRRNFFKTAGFIAAGLIVMPSRTMKGMFLPSRNNSLGKRISGTTGAKWVPVVCWHDCGGRCVLKALVVNNKIIRVKSDDTHKDSPDYPQQRACVRGRSQRMQVCAPDRLKYPMRRKHWSPGGGDKSLRGKDEWIRISWGEALDIVANELKRIKKEYGNESIFSPGGEIKRTLNLFGGCVDSWSNDSLGAWMGTGKHIGLYARRPNGGFNWTGCIGDRMDLRNSQLVVMWGVNPAWSSPGNPTYNFLQVKKAGARFIFIDPFYSSSAVALADEWIPIRPGTDHAMILGMMHTLLIEDDPVKNPLIDRDFLNRCSVGFDRDHMPEGADPEENFKDYLLGFKDGRPKDAVWASEICGIPAERIKTLARDIGRTEKVALLTSWAPARVNNSDSWPQAFMALGCMTGHIGESGRMTGTSVHIASGNGGPPLVYAGSSGLAEIPNPVGGGSNYTRGRPENKLSIPGNQIWNAILTGEYTAGRGRMQKIDIRLMYLGGVTNMLGSREGQKKGFEAIKKPDLVVCHAHFLNTTAQYSDIVLPVTTQWERLGLLQDDGNREAIFFGSKAIQPLFEAKDDMWIAKETGKRLDLDVNEIESITAAQQLYNSASGAMVIKEDGKDYEPLLTITMEDIKALGVNGSPQKGRISFREFREKGVFQVQRSPDDNFRYIPFKEFRKDPVKNPLTTKSGKLEIHCQDLAEYVSDFGWDTIKPIPEYIKPIEGYEGTFTDWKSRKKGDFPLQFYSVHYLRRAGSTYDNVSWLRESWPQEFFMNPLDAEERGIRHGETVKAQSRHGAVIRRAHLTNRIRPGVTSMGAGAWSEPDEKPGVDLAGSSNMLAGDISTGQGTSGWNSCLVEVVKYETELLPDHKWPTRIIFKDEAHE